MIRYGTSIREEFMRDYYYHYFFLAHKHLSEQGLRHFQDGPYQNRLQSGNQADLMGQENGKCCTALRLEAGYLGISTKNMFQTINLESRH